jgi:hypothetical protein
VAGAIQVIAQCGVGCQAIHFRRERAV